LYLLIWGQVGAASQLLDTLVELAMAGLDGAEPVVVAAERNELLHRAHLHKGRTVRSGHGHDGGRSGTALASLTKNPRAVGAFLAVEMPFSLENKAHRDVRPSRPRSRGLSYPWKVELFLPRGNNRAGTVILPDMTIARLGLLASIGFAFLTGC